MKTKKQIRHEKLIDFLNQFEQYQTADGNPLCKKIDKTIGSAALCKLNINDLNKGVVVLTDYFNLCGGSIGGDIDLYQLLQAYFLHPEKRKGMNLIATSRVLPNPVNCN
jgi:hypothetical protein